MSNLSSAILIYSITIIFFLLSNKTIYVYTLKFYGLFEYINDDKNSLKILVNHLLIYKIIIRYIRIHLICCSIFITISFFIKMPLITSVVKLSMIIVMLITICDVLSLKARLKALEDRLYKTYYRAEE